MLINIRKITENEREQLHRLTSCTDEAVARRARAVLMALEGMDVVAIAQSLSISERTVRNAVKRFNDGGTEALCRRVSPGRPRSVSDQERESLIAVIRRSPAEFGIHTERWNLADIEACFLDDFPDSDEDDLKLIRTATEAYLMMSRALAADCPDAAMRASRRFRKAIKTLETRKRQRSNKQTTPVDWAANLLR